MLLFVAYAGVGQATGTPLASSIERVEHHYSSRWSTTPTRHATRTDSAGIVLWEAEEHSRWPSWASDDDVTVASLYVPIGYEKVVAAEPLSSAPLRLAQALQVSPECIDRVCPPFVCAALETSEDRLTLHTDALGVGRLYEVRSGGGRVWSNRPEAALVFAGLPLRPDDVGWAHIAVADEMFGSVTPYAGVRAIDGATCIRWDGRDRRLVVSTIDTVASWSRTDVDAADLISDVAEDLALTAASVSRLYPQRPVVDLTGGRDSRLVAAAFLAAGTDVRLHTHDALPGDLDVALDLVHLAGRPLDHHVEHMPTGRVSTRAPWQAMEHARAWHRFAEGLRPYSYLHQLAPTSLDRPYPLAIGGAGGEVAHGYFYPARLSHYTDLPTEQMLSRFTDVILRRYAPIAGAHPDAISLVRHHILGTLRHIAERGYPDATVLDVFYMSERIRRWGTTGERTGVVSPLLSPAFLTAALSLTPEQRTGNTLHRELTRHLLPAWADVPYFPSETGRAPAAAAGPTHAPPRVIRMGDACDRDAINSLLHDRHAWHTLLDDSILPTLWQNSVADRTDARQERLLRAMIWRGAFLDHLAETNGTTTPRPVVPWTESQTTHPAADTPTPTTAPGTPSGTPGMLPARTDTTPPQRRLVSTLARHLAASTTWTHLRTTPIGAAVRRSARYARRHGVPL